MDTQDPSSKFRSSEVKVRLDTLSRTVEEIVDRAMDRAQPASVWSREMISRVERNAAKGLWNAAAQLDRAAKKLDAAGRELAKPGMNGHTRASASSNGMGEEGIAPHLA
jgi:hypothetical protein